MSRMNGYLSDNSYSRSSSGGYLDGLQTPNWNKMFGEGGYGANGGNANVNQSPMQKYWANNRHQTMDLLAPMGGDPFQTTGKLAAYQNDREMSKTLGPILAQADAAKEMQKMQMMGEYEMFRQKLAASQAESERQRQMQREGYLNNYAQRRANSYLGYGLD